MRFEPKREAFYFALHAEVEAYARDVKRYLASVERLIPSYMSETGSRTKSKLRYPIMESTSVDSATTRWELTDEEKKWARAGIKIEAIKLHRLRTSCTLVESKRIVDLFIESLPKPPKRLEARWEEMRRAGRIRYNIVFDVEDIITIEKCLGKEVSTVEIKAIFMGIFNGTVKLMR